VSVTRNEHADSIVLRASHDGYGRFGIIHQRALMLTAGGSKLEGEDVFMPMHGEVLPHGAQDEFAIRFHLHPAVKASRHSDGHGAMLVLPNKDVWTFDSHEDRVELEESVYLGGSEGPRRTVQIVIYGRARQVPRVHWTFTHAPRPATPRKGTETASRKKPENEPELPL
jgi:uncharacterized heparinase superfamily protein